MFEAVFSQMQQSWTGWGELCKEQLEAAHEQASQLQRQGVEQTAEVIEQVARLAKASVEQADRLSADWRRMTLDTWRRSVELMTPPTPSATASAEG